MNTKQRGAQLLTEIFSKKVVKTAVGRLLPLHSHLPLPECRLLQEWILIHRPRTVLEIGLAYGISALAICNALESLGEGATFLAIDPNQHRDWQGIGLLNLKRGGFGTTLHFFPEPSELCLPRLRKEGWLLDFAFVDGCHRLDQVSLEFNHLDSMLRSGGIIAFDDIHLKEIGYTCDRISAMECYSELPIPPKMASLKTARIRKMHGLPSFRIRAFLKDGS